MNERRTNIVQMAFDILDRDKSGTVTVDEITDVYDFTHHPDVKSGKKTLKDAAKEFMATWEQGEFDGVVTWEEFVDYYKEISASIDGDDYFELMIRNAWRIAGGTGQAANTANRRVLVTNRDGSQSVQTINNELGLKASDINAVKARLAQQGVDAANVDLFGGLDTTEKRGAGGKGPPARLGGARAQQAWGPPQGMEGFSPRPRAGDESTPPPDTPTNGNGNRRNGNINNLNSSSAAAQVPRRGSDNVFEKSQPQQQAVAVSASASNIFDPWDTMRKLLYTPPLSFEQLGGKLAVSVVSSTPRIAKGAFISR